MAFVPIPGGYPLSQLNTMVNTTDTQRQRRLGRGQTLVLMNGCTGEVTQTVNAATATRVWPSGHTHYQIPTQGSAVVFRQNPNLATVVQTVNGAGASDGYRTWQFWGDFQDALGVNPNGGNMPSYSNQVMIAHPLVAGSENVQFTSIGFATSGATAFGTDAMVFVTGGWNKDSFGYTEVFAVRIYAINTASLAGAQWGDSCPSISGNSETDGDIAVVTAGRNPNSTTASANMRMFNISTPAGSAQSADGDAANYLYPQYPAHGCAGSSSDGSRIIIAGGVTGTIDQVTAAGIARSTITQRGFRIPVLSRNFGDLTQARVQLSGGSDGSRAVFVGGSDTVQTAGVTSGVTNYKTMDMVNISTPGNATTFGTVQSAVYNPVSFGGQSGWVVGTSGDHPSRGYAVASCT